MAKTLYYNAVTEEMEFVNNPSPLRENLGERFGLNEGGRINMKPGGIVEPGMRQGFQNPGLVTQIPKIPGYIKTAKKVWNTGKQIFNSFKNLSKTKTLKNTEMPAVKSAISKGVKEDLGYGLSVADVTTKGNITYASRFGQDVKYGTDLPALIMERNTWVANKVKPLVDKGFVSSKDLLKILTDKGIKILEPDKELARIASTYGIEKVESPFRVNAYWFKNPSPEKLESIYKLRLKPKERISIAKDFIKKFEITSHQQLNKIMNEQGYSKFKSQEMTKLFPEIKGISFTDPKFIPLDKTFTARSVLNSLRYNLKKEMSGLKTEMFLVAAKKATKLGKKVHLEHTEPKRKLTGELLKWEDLAFGSAKENDAYANGVERIRRNFGNILSNVLKKHNGKDMNAVIETSPLLRRDYGFPDKMTVKEYVSRINDGLIDLAAKTHGKVRGDILNIIGNKMKFIPNETAIDFSKVPGWGMLSGDIKKFDKLFNKIRMKNHNIVTEKQPKISINDKGERFLVKDAKGNQIFEEMPAIKRWAKLTTKEAEDILMVWGNLPNQVRRALSTKPFKGKLEFAEGGRIGLQDGTVWGTAKEIGKKVFRGPLRAVGRSMSPIVYETLAALHYQITGEMPDPTKTEELLVPAFWNSIMKQFNWADKSTDPLKKRILSFIKRGGIPTTIMPLVSRIATIAMPIAETYQATKTGLVTIPEKEKKIAQIAKDKGWDVEETLNMYRMNFDQPKLNRETFYKKWLGKMPNLSTIQDVLKSPEYQERKKYFNNDMIEQYFKNKDVDVMEGSVIDKYNEGGLTGVNRYSQLIK